MWTYRRILLVPWRKKRTNEWVQKLTTKRMLFEQITSRKLRFIGDALRPDGLEKNIIQDKVEGKARKRKTPWTVALTSRSGLDSVSGRIWFGRD